MHLQTRAESPIFITTEKQLGPGLGASERFNPDTTNYECPKALCQTPTCHDPHPRSAIIASERLRFPTSIDQHESVLPDKFPGVQRCRAATSSCSCEPARIDIQDLRVGHFVQVKDDFEGQTSYRAMEVVGVYPERRALDLKECCDLNDGDTSFFWSGFALQSGTSDASPWKVEVALTGSCLLSRQGSVVELWKCGFVSNPSATCDGEFVREYGLTGVWTRRIFKMKCMFGICKIWYDGEEDGMFRWSHDYLFGQEVFRLFNWEKMNSR